MTALHQRVLSRQNVTPSTARVFLGFWTDSSKSIKDASHPNLKSSSARRFTVYKFSLSSTSNEQAVRGCVSHPFFFAVFLSTGSSPLFMIQLHILFFVAVHAARSFWNLPLKNCCSCCNVSVGKEIGVQRKSFAFVSTPRAQL